MANVLEDGAKAPDHERTPPIPTNDARPKSITTASSDSQESPRDSPSVAPPAASGSMPPPATPSGRREYQPQFTAMTETILERMRTGNTTLSLAIAGATANGEVHLNPAKFEDARRRLIESLKTSDNVQLPAVPTPRIKGASPRTPGSTTPQGLKRKRTHLDRGSPFSDPDADGPQLKKLAPRAPVRKKKGRDDGRRRCSRCDRQAFTEENFFVTCPRCEESWHLLCNPPEVVRAWHEDSSRFRCFGCLEEARQMEEFQKAKAEFAQFKRHVEITRSRERLVAGLPIGVSFDKPDRIGFGAGNGTDAEREEYFSSMPRRELLSLLAFCDKLRPNLLVDLLVSVTKRHPDLPIFSSPDWHTQVTPGSSSGRKSLSIDTGQRTPQTPSASNGQASGISTPSLSAATKQAAPPKQTQTVDAADPWDDDDDFLPPSWPKEGEGMYAALPPEDKDGEHLVDKDAEGAFQGFMVKGDAEGKIKVEPTVCC